MWLKKYSSFGECITDHFTRYQTGGQWPSAFDVIKRADFTSDDIDIALRTGTHTPTDAEKKEANKTQTWCVPYNTDIDVPGSGFTDGKNHYGEILFNNMNDQKIHFAAALNNRISQNNMTIAIASGLLASKDINLSDEMKTFLGFEIIAAKAQNAKLQGIVDQLQPKDTSAKK
ncbi:MAG TPA: hypothetical protein VN922_06200, partial [Bacteroidia bacterium]|nr:hypothetical protein [Bacteroidia bacterium]